MGEAPESATHRGVRIHTLMGEIAGWLSCSRLLRTIDDLNLEGRNFLTVHEPTGNFEAGSLGSGAISINKASILFLTEVSAFPSRAAHQPGPGRYSRAALCLRVADHDITGFVHVPPGGDPLTRLNISGRPFMALTAASINGSNVELVAPFLAINRAHILAAQEIDVETPGDDPVCPLDEDERLPQG